MRLEITGLSACCGRAFLSARMAAQQARAEGFDAHAAGKNIRQDSPWLASRGLSAEAVKKQPRIVFEMGTKMCVVVSSKDAWAEAKKWIIGV